MVPEQKHYEHYLLLHQLFGGSKLLELPKDDNVCKCTMKGYNTIYQHV